MSEQIKNILEKWEQRPRRVIDYTNPDDTNWNNELLLAVKAAIPLLQLIAVTPPELESVVAQVEKPAEPKLEECPAPEQEATAIASEAPQPPQDSVTPVLRQPETPPEAPKPAPARRGGRKSAKTTPAA